MRDRAEKRVKGKVRRPNEERERENDIMITKIALQTFLFSYSLKGAEILSAIRNSTSYSFFRLLTISLDNRALPL